MKELTLRKYLDDFLNENPKNWDWVSKGTRAACLKELLYWLDLEKWKPEDLDPVRMRRFTAYLIKKKFNQQKRYHIRLTAFAFFEWLQKKDYPIRAPSELLPYQKPRSEFINVELPSYTKEFLDYTSTRVKPSTTAIYRTNCKHFHKFLNQQQIGLKDLNRRVMEQYFKFLVDNQQRQSTRVGNLVHTRIYLEWLKERKLVSCKPKEMVRPIDMPKVPDYLPRPLPPAIDQLIQKRLAKSEDRFHRALLLMRWTGIRVGELRNLNFDCIKTDIHGHKFLKVPLGKLDNERLVPLDKKAVHLIKTIQEQTSSFVNQQADFLLAQKTLLPPRTYLIMSAFREIYEDIKTEEPIVTHRLRHTYATELLSAGMNICALKEILGHRDINMTLRYAAVTQEKVRKEYFAALERMKTGFDVECLPMEIKELESDYESVLSDLILKLKKRAPIKGVSQNKVFHLTKRINRMKKEVRQILN